MTFHGEIRNEGRHASNMVSLDVACVEDYQGYALAVTCLSAGC